jgi:stage V sporulation protein G
MDIKVKIHTLHTEGGRLADASVTLDGCFAIRGVKIINGSKGPFVSMPSYKSGEQYRDLCFPCTKEFKQEFDRAVLDAYQLQLTQVQRPPEPEQAGPTMNM